jgi:hypothetical protein
MLEILSFAIPSMVAAIYWHSRTGKRKPLTARRPAQHDGGFDGYVFELLYQILA